MRYRFWLICINYNFDFLVLYKMYLQNYFARRSIILESFTSHLQHSRPCCIGYTNSRLRLEFVYLIQHGRSCCKYYLLTKWLYNLVMLCVIACSKHGFSRLGTYLLNNTIYYVLTSGSVLSVIRPTFEHKFVKPIWATFGLTKSLFLLQI